MKRKFKLFLNTCSVAVLIVAIVVSVGMFLAREGVAAWDGTATSTFASGSGTKASPYVISTQKQMGYFMNRLNAGVTYEGLYIKLNSDLDMTGGNWSVSENTVFAGAFLGNDKTLTMDSNFLGTIAATGVVDWLNLKGSGTLSTPLLCYNNNGTIQNCSVRGNVSMTSTSQAGLLCLNNNSPGLVVNSYGIGSVHGEADDDDCYVGWIGKSEGTIKNSYAVMTLSGSAPGRYNTLYTGQITAKGNYENCYSGTKVIKNDSSFVATLNGSMGVPGYIWAVDSSYINEGYPVIKSCLSAMTQLKGNSESLVVFHDTSFSATLSSSESGCTIYYTLDGTDPTTSSTRKTYNGAFTISGDTVITSVAYKNGSYGVPNSQQMVQLLGSGTAQSPYIVSTNKQLYAIRLETDKVYELNRDLDFTNEPKIYQGENWESIPTFSGELRGNGHSITGLTSITGGLVGRNNGVIQELRLIDHQLCVSTNDYYPSCFGAIANYNSGTITRCYAGTDPDVIRYTSVFTNYVGGIVGHNLGTISYCSSSGTIKLTSNDDYSWYQLGGIAGSNSKTIQSCYSDMRLYGARTSHDLGAYIIGIAFGGTVYDSRFDGHCEVDCYTASFGIGAGAAHGDSAWSYRIYNGGATFNHISSSGRTFFTQETDLYSHKSFEESSYSAFDFDEVWMMTANGPMPQGIMDAEGRCMAKYSYTKSTCSTAGSAVSYDMLNTGYRKTDTLPLAEHRYTSVVTAPTCTDLGYTTYTCSCGDTYTEEIAANGHTEVVDPAVAATCTETGLAEGKHCSTCGDVLLAQQIVPVTGHAEIQHEAKKPTETETGWEAYVTCENCDYTTYIETPAILTFALNSDQASYSVADCAQNVTIVTIPTMYKGLPVTSIGDDAFSDCSSLTSITIPDNITSIDDYAFYNCSSLTSITIPDSITSIGDHVFYYCPSLTSITIPDGITSIGDFSFYQCESLTSITIPDSVTSIGAGAFCGCSSLMSITFTGIVEQWNVIEKGLDWDFGFCTVQVVCSDGIVCLTHTEETHDAKAPTCTEIGWDAYITCSVCDYSTYAEKAALGHTEVIDEAVEPTCTKTGLTEGKHCSTCSEVLVAQQTIPATGHSEITHEAKAPTETEVGWEAYVTCKNCEYTTYVEIPAILMFTLNSDQASYSVTDCAQKATIVTIPATYNGKPVTSIGYKAFAHCKSLTSITLPNSLISIEACAFDFCSGLTSITIPDSVTSIGICAFYDCTGLTSIVIPNSVTMIGRDVFYGCSSLENITLPFVGALNPDDGIFYTNFGSVFGAYGGNRPYVGNKRYVPTSLKTVVITGGSTICANAFYNCSGLTSITIPYSVTSIGDYAFYNCSSLTSITIPDGVTSIGEDAFSGCKSLTSITIPDSVTSIEDDAFYGCLALSTVNYLGTKEEWNAIVVFGDYNDTLLNATINFLCELDHVFVGSTCIMCNGTYEGVIFEYYSYCSGYFVVGYEGTATNIAIPKIYNGYPVVCIAEDAFHNFYCSDITSISIPDSVTWIEDGAFYDQALTSIIIPNSVTEIDEYAFGECRNLEQIIIGSNVAYIRHGAFYSCDKLVRVKYMGTEEKWNAITIGDSNEALLNATINFLGEYYTEGLVFELNVDEKTYGVADYIGTMVEVVIPSEYQGLPVTSICESAFYNCSSLTSIIIPDSVTSIGNNAFEYCRSLESIEIPNSVTSIGDHAFDVCDSLMSIVIPNSVTSIGSYAFSNCFSLTSIVIPDSVTSLSKGVFCNCDRLASIEIPNSVTSISEYSFFNCRKFKTVYYTGTEVQWKNISIGDNNDSLINADKAYLFYTEGLVFTLNSAKTEYSVTGYTGTSTEVIIPATYEELPVTSIGDSAFNNCSWLTSITIPDGVTNIGNHAFYRCSNLTSITIPDSITNIGVGAFYDCSSLISITIPDSITKIGYSTFRYCSGLINIIIPDSVTIIDNYAFEGCSTLSTVNYLGTEKEWNAITIGVSNETLLNATIHFAKEETIVEITVNNVGNEISGAVITAPEGGWVIGCNTFTVTCDKVCFAVVSYDNGATYTRIVSTAVGEAHSFTTDITDASTIISVVVAGDSNGDGTITNADSTRLSAAYAGKIDISVLQSIAADVNGDGVITNADITKLRAAYAEKTQLTW